tara:strand:- start:864 stop:1052 length:189 start_codon:yes stop_codon:yes gene_type:complete
MFGDDNFTYSEIGNSILEGKDQCPDTSCIRNLIDFLQEQIDLLEDECYERENDLQKIYNEDE